ncbi:unnamed protein product [Pieris brassicae]|uniref:Uncharacterized protein n=1 Tax=Pieris brassicae TaxID=7116 RepID=A0A9P0TXC8_PIEBR|nr:unnamed protein product [Pieris brassicae]
MPLVLRLTSSFTHRSQAIKSGNVVYFVKESKRNKRELRMSIVKDNKLALSAMLGAARESEILRERCIGSLDPVVPPARLAPHCKHSERTIPRSVEIFSVL